MIKFILCEDKKEDMDILNKTVVKTMMNYDIDYRIHKFSGYNEELKKQIHDKSDFKIYLLDVEMKGITGLEMASEIREEDSESKIIFITAHPECANDIFYSRLEAIDYILKGIRYDERLEESIKYILDKRYQEETLTFTNNYVRTILKYKEINYIEKVPLFNKCKIVLVDGETKYIKASIKGLKKELGSCFFISHKSCIINLQNIKEVNYAKSTIKFCNGDTTDLLAPKARKELRSLVGEFYDFI